MASGSRSLNDIHRRSSPFLFDSVIYNGFDYPPDGIGNHLSLFDRLIFDGLPAERKSLSAVPSRSAPLVYGKVTTDLHLEHPDRFKNCLFLDIARETWNPDLIREQMMKTVRHKRVFNAVTAVYLMWESDRLWDLYADLVSVYDFCIVTAPLLDEFLSQRGIDFVKLRHPYDFHLSRSAAGRNAQPLRFGMSTGLWPRKNTSLLARQFVEVFGDDPEVELSIHTRSDLTQPEFKTEYRILSELAERHPGIRILNESLSREAYLGWLKSIDVYCFISAGEGYSVTPREALHLGIPVILHDAHVHRELSHLPGVVRVSSRGLKRALSNAPTQDLEVGRDWQIDEGSLRQALASCRDNYPRLKARLNEGYHQILELHDPDAIKREWVETLNRKYGEYRDRVRVSYPGVPEAGINSFPNDEDVDSISLRSGGFGSNAGCRLPGRIHCLKAEHPAGHCLFGPNLRITRPGKIRVSFVLEVFSGELPWEIANLDIYDSAGDTILCLREIHDVDVQSVVNTFTISADVEPGQALEFRVYWFGDTDMCVSDLEVEFSVP